MSHDDQTSDETPDPTRDDETRHDETRHDETRHEARDDETTEESTEETREETRGASPDPPGPGSEDEVDPRAGSADETVRRESWSCDGPAELDLSVDLGRLDLTLVEDSGTVEVEVRHDPRGGSAWEQGLSGLLGWLGEATGRGSIRIGGRNLRLDGLGLDPAELFGTERGGQLGSHLGGYLGGDPGAEAVRACEMDWSPGGRRLVVRSTTTLPLRLVPISVTVRAPAGSRLTLRTGGGDIAVTGRAGDTTVRTGAGDVRLGEVDGAVEVTTGSGRVVSGRVSGRTTARTGSGDLTMAALGGPAEVRVGSGTVRLGGVRGDLLARSGSGDLSIEDAEVGRIDLTTGSGDLRVGVHPGVTAELDLSSGSGRVRSELDVSGTAPEGRAGLVVRGRTGSGDVLVTRAMATTG